MTNKTNEIVTVKSVNNIDITPVFNEIIEYAKDQATVGDIESIISSVPTKDSMDWKLISGVLMNATVEWVVANKDKDNIDSLDLIRHLQKDIGYLLKRLGLAI
jgi:hypothetical protein|tara:strand:- start:198 stop:506 length:309 start_codon:yes stop_codon:yes gene_type:complete